MMPLITHIHEPERFNSAVMAGYALDWLRDQKPSVVLTGVVAGEQRVMMDAIQYALDRMKAEGIVN